MLMKAILINTSVKRNFRRSRPVNTEENLSWNEHVNSQIVQKAAFSLYTDS